MHFWLRHARARLAFRSWTLSIFQGIDLSRKLWFGLDFAGRRAGQARAKPNRMTGKLDLSDVTLCIADCAAAAA